MLRLDIATVSPIPDRFHDKPVNFSGITTYQPERGTEWDECYAVGELQLLSDASARVKAKLLIRFQDPVPLRYGKGVTLTGVFQEPRGKRNPGRLRLQNLPCKTARRRGRRSRRTAAAG